MDIKPKKGYRIVARGRVRKGDFVQIGEGWAAAKNAVGMPVSTRTGPNIGGLCGTRNFWVWRTCRKATPSKK